MTHSACPASKSLLLLALGAQSNAALAHGEGYLLAGAGGAALVIGGVFGIVAALRSPQAFPSYAHSLGLFMGIGGVVAWVAAGSSEGLALFLVFGGVGGALPLAAGYFCFRYVAVRCRNAIAKRLAQSRTEA